MGSILGSSGDMLAPLTQSLGVSTAMPTMGVPSSVTPISQQIAAMSQPSLSMPAFGGEQKLPSLGVDLSMPTSIETPGLFSQLGSGLSNINEKLGAIEKYQPKTEPMQMMQLAPMRQAGPLQSNDLLALLRNLGGLQ